jgi:hypothetical protein
MQSQLPSNIRLSLRKKNLLTRQRYLTKDVDIVVVVNLLTNIVVILRQQLRSWLITLVLETEVGENSFMWKRNDELHFRQP